MGWQDAPIIQRADAPPPAAPAQAAPAWQSAPIADSAPAPAPTPPPVQSYPTAPTMKPDELKSGLMAMVRKGATPDDMREFMRQNGYQPDDSSNRYLKDHYKPGQQIDFNVTGPKPEETSVLSSIWHGIQSGALGGFDDELAAAGGVVGNKLGTALGLNSSNMTVPELYDAILQQTRAAKEQAYNDHPLAYGAGFVPGALLMPVKGMQAETALGRFGNMALQGGQAGAISAAGNSDGGLTDRAGNALVGGLEGMVLGPLVGGALSKVGGGAAALARRAGLAPGARAETSGLDALHAVAPQDPAAMAAKADELRAAGVEPRLMDVIDQSGRRVVRTAADRPGAGQEAAVQHADQVYQDIQPRVVQQAQRISGAPTTARKIAADVAEQQQKLGPQFDAVRDAPVDLTPDIQGALNTAEGRTVLRYIGRYMTPDEQGNLNNLTSALAKAAKLGSPEQQAEKLMPQFPQLGPQAQQSVLAQMTQQGLIEDPLANAKLTVDIADKFARVLTKRAGDTPALMRVAQDMADTVRGAARSQYPAYDAALNEFAGAARVGDAASGTGRYEGNSDFLRTPAEQFNQTVAAAPAIAPPNAPASEAEALAARARDAVTEAATRNPRAALTTADAISRGGQMAQKADALLGPDEGAALRAGMGAEAERYRNTQFIDPRTGSKTHGMGVDEEAVSGLHDMINAGAAAATGNKWALAKTVQSWFRRAGMRSVDSERIVRDAISDDPGKVQASIDYLTSKGVPKNVAHSILQTISRGGGAKLGGRVAGAAAGDEQPSQAPNSVRAIMRGN